MSVDNDVSVWTWLVGAVSSVGVGLISGTWAASKKMAQHEMRLAAIELSCSGHAAFCAKQKEDLLEAVRKEICNIVKLAIKDLTIEHHSSISSLDKNVALIAQSNEQMEKHIIEIFNRLNRRDTDNPSGKERRGHGV